MVIEILKLGSLETNCYVLKNGNHALIIDPADEADKIIASIEGYILDGVLITHYHFDHISALSEIKEKYNPNIYDYNLEEKEYQIGKFKFNIIHTKGHTLDSVTFYFKEDKIMFTGDFIFKGTIGRTDLNGSNIEMIKSIEKIKKYPNAKIYPGHGDITYLDIEKNSNYYFT